MSYENQEFTEHVMYHNQFRKNCEFCAALLHPRKKVVTDAMLERFRRAANAADRIAEVVKIMNEAEKNNPKGLIF